MIEARSAMSLPIIEIKNIKASKNNSSKLNNAKNTKNDEFYTSLSDIQKEMEYHIKSFKDKIVYCNCDDYEKSNFFKYFRDNFKSLGLKELVATCYDNGEGAKIARYDGVNLSSGFLKGNGDFASNECKEVLESCDIVVTNPPFSLFRQFIDILISNKKEFLIIGNSNAITYKNCFNHIMNNQLWLGQNCVRWFINTNHELVEGARSFWFTNINNQKRNKKLALNKKYNNKDYVLYDNYNAIEVSKTKEIPLGYNGIMGVPITFLDKYNPQQFEIIGADYQVKSGELFFIKQDGWAGKTDRAYIKGKRLYSRIFIKHRNTNNAI